MNRQDLIEKYISGELTHEERQEFTNLSENDLSFNEELTFHINLQKVTANEDNLSFKKTITAFETAHQTQKINKRVWWIAASFIGLLLLTYLFGSQKTSTETLFAENFVPYRNVIQPIVRSEPALNLKTKAFLAYENRDYQKAVQLFSELLVSESESYPTFYLANSYLAINNTKEAISLFTEYIEAEETYKDKATWYLALTYLRVNNITETKKLLQKISSEKTYNYLKAEALLKKVN